jgi:hypothetical protein
LPRGLGVPGAAERAGTGVDRFASTGKSSPAGAEVGGFVPAGVDRFVVVGAGVDRLPAGVVCWAWSGIATAETRKAKDNNFFMG